MISLLDFLAQQMPQFPEIEDAAGILERRGLPQWVWFAAGAVVAVSLLAGFLARQRSAAAKTPRRIALDRLADIQGRLDALNAREAAFAISDVLREFLTRARGLRATTQTTQEFLSEVSAKGALTADISGLLGEFLRQCDYTKFAPHSEEPELKSALYAQAVELVGKETA